MKADFVYTGIRVRDLERSIAFYTKILNMQVTGRQRGDYIVFCDDDVIVGRKTIGNLVGILSSRDGAGAIGCALLTDFPSRFSQKGVDSV